LENRHPLGLAMTGQSSFVLNQNRKSWESAGKLKGSSPGKSCTTIVLNDEGQPIDYRKGHQSKGGESQKARKDAIERMGLAREKKT